MPCWQGICSTTKERTAALKTYLATGDMAPLAACADVVTVAYTDWCGYSGQRAKDDLPLSEYNTVMYANAAYVALYARDVALRIYYKYKLQRVTAGLRPKGRQARHAAKNSGHADAGATRA